MFVKQDTGEVVVFELLVSFTVIISEKPSQKVTEAALCRRLETGKPVLMNFNSLTVFPALLIRLTLILTPPLALQCREIDEQMTLISRF